MKQDYVASGTNLQIDQNDNMHREILSQPLLLKKYSTSLIHDYTEYPTKFNWKEDYKSLDFKKDLGGFVENQKEPAMLYIHTPFCEELCYFCLCSKSITKEYAKVKRYLHEDLFKEIEMYENLSNSIGRKIKVGEIYYGGGSPTYYNEEDFLALTNKLKKVFDWSESGNFTVEIDPRRVDVNKLKFYHKCGVNRLSFGIQDFDEGVQKEINRIQPPELLHTLLTPEIRKLFPVFNFDLLVGLPRQTPETMRRTIESVLELRPPEIEPLYVHFKPNTRSYMTRMTRNVLMPDFYDRKTIYAEVIDGLIDGGYMRTGYEKFALPTDIVAKAMKTGKAYYNSIGTTAGEVTTFISLGSSGHGNFNNEVYYQNFYEQDLYKKALHDGDFPTYRGWRFSENDRIRHSIIKHFRTFDTLDLVDFNKKWNIDFHNYFAKEIDNLGELIGDGLVEVSDNKFVMTRLGREFTPRVCEIFDNYAGRDLYDKSMKKVFAMVQE